MGIIIHDLKHIDRPQNSSRLKTIYYPLIMRRACRNAAAVLAPSEFSRQLITGLGVNAGRVINIGNGADHSYNLDATAYAPDFLTF